jgi:hypothetical protein
VVQAAVAAVAGQALDDGVDHLDAGAAGGRHQPGDVRHHPRLEIGDKGRVLAADRIRDLEVLDIDQQQRGGPGLDRNVAAQAGVGGLARSGRHGGMVRSCGGSTGSGADPTAQGGTTRIGEAVAADRRLR